MRSRATASSSRGRGRGLGARACLLAAAVAVGAPAASAQDPPAEEPTAPVARPMPPSTALNGHLRAGIVRVVVSGQEWNWKTPWAKQPPWTRPVTGLVVPGRRILCASTAFAPQV